MPKKQLIGTVVSDKMDKTVVVEVQSQKPHAIYGKVLKTSLRYKAHDEKNEYKVGSNVIIEEHRPISRDKRWVVVGLYNKA